VDEAREGRDDPAVGGVSVRNSVFRFVLVSTARRVLRFEEEVADWLAVASAHRAARVTTATKTQWQRRRQQQPRRVRTTRTRGAARMRWARQEIPALQK
jgi:hypothetical protein